MSEYPEKVYVSTNVYDRHYIVPGEFADGAVVYERVDVAGYPIISKLEAQLAEAWAEIKTLQEEYNAGYDAGVRMERKLHEHELAELKAQLAEESEDRQHLWDALHELYKYCEDMMGLDTPSASDNERRMMGAAKRALAGRGGEDE